MKRIVLCAALLLALGCREYAPVASEVRKEVAPSAETPNSAAPSIEKPESGPPQD